MGLCSINNDRSKNRESQPKDSSTSDETKQENKNIKILIALVLNIDIEQAFSKNEIIEKIENCVPTEEYFLLILLFLNAMDVMSKHMSLLLIIF